MNLSLYTVRAMIVLDTDGNRVLAKYYNPKESPAPKNMLVLKDQQKFEKGLYAKTKKPGSDIILYEGQLAVYRHSLDLIFYIIGAASENELMLHSALNAFFDAVSMVLRNQVEKRGILEGLDMVLLCLDETIDEGIIVETDSMAIASRVSRPRADAADMGLNEETVKQAVNAGREFLKQRFAQF